MLQNPSMRHPSRINVVCVHHHLNRGGVTHVILNQLSSLEKIAEQGREIHVAILFGGRGSIDEKRIAKFEALNLKLVEIPQLEYDSLREDFSRDHELDRLMIEKLEELSFDRSNTILHVHNHCLGKNGALALALQSLAREGFRLFLQLHDFAEDFRAKNYRSLTTQLSRLGGSMSDVYPDAKQIHYSAINRRDKQKLSQLGLSKSVVHYLPNAVPLPAVLPDHQTAKAEFATNYGLDPNVPLLIYPVRGIRRKNIGEAILLTAISADPICVGLTLAPLNEVEAGSYNHWKQFATDLHLPVLFDLATELSFETNIAAANSILMTSVAEGFGLVFLESFSFGKQLTGRDLASVTDDFRQQGIQFERLYSEIRIPLQLVNRTDFKQQLQEILTQTWSQYQQPFESENVDQYFTYIEEQGWIDFAMLTCDQQRHVIASAVRDPRVSKTIEDHNQKLIQWLGSIDDNDASCVPENQKAVKEKFSIASSGDQLVEIYDGLFASPVSEVGVAPKPNAVLESFLSIEHFHPIRAESRSQDVSKSGDSDLSTISDALTAIAPIPTSVEPKLEPLKNIKAVLFDIYGTLLVSSSGDVGTDPAFQDQQRNEDQRLDQLLAGFSLDLATATQRLSELIKEEHRQLRDAGIPFPEIEIRELWQSILRASESQDVPAVVVEEVALRFELLKNPVWKMPGFDECLSELRGREIPVGIISNAQFYTSRILEALSSKTMAELGFRRNLSHFSFRIGRAKPDQFLYKVAAESLRPHGIQPNEVLYIGNDMTKDIIPAKETGFVTGLFAGDQRSLRCGDHGDPHNHHAVDLIFTDLFQISNALRLT